MKTFLLFNSLFCSLLGTLLILNMPLLILEKLLNLQTMVFWKVLHLVHIKNSVCYFLSIDGNVLLYCNIEIWRIYTPIYLFFYLRSSPAPHQRKVLFFNSLSYDGYEFLKEIQVNIGWHVPAIISCEEELCQD